MRKYFMITLSFFLFFLSFSCKDNVPELTIPEEKLIRIVFDLHAANYVINRASPDEKDSLSNVYKNQIYKIYKINKNELDRNLKTLQAHPEFFRNFYEKLNKYGDTLMIKPKVE